MFKPNMSTFKSNMSTIKPKMSMSFTKSNSVSKFNTFNFKKNFNTNVNKDIETNTWKLLTNKCTVVEINMLKQSDFAIDEQVIRKLSSKIAMNTTSFKLTGIFFMRGIGHGKCLLFG